VGTDPKPLFTLQRWVPLPNPCPCCAAIAFAPNGSLLVTIAEGILKRSLYRIGTVLRCPLSTTTNSRNTNRSVALALR
jgi:hypothetical protein